MRRSGQRIEEHGLHIWFGFYDNAFKTIQRAYELLGRPPGAPLATWRDAFGEQHFITLTEQVGGEWRLWPIDTPPMPGVPGDGDEKLDLWRIALTAYEWIKQWVETLCTEHAPPPKRVAAGAGASSAASSPGWSSKVEDEVEELVHDVVEDCVDALHGLRKPRRRRSPPS